MSSRLHLPDVDARRFGTALAVLCLAAILSFACATGSALRAGEQAERAQDFDRAVADYTLAVRDRPDDRNARGALQRARLRAAEQHFFAGRRLAADDKYEEALVELQLAFELNPADGQIEAALREARQRHRTMISVSHEGKTELQSLVERSRNMPPPGLDLPAGATLPDSLVFSNASSRAIFTAIARFSGLSIVFDPAFRDVPLTVDLRNTSLADALAAVTAGTHTFYKLTAQRTLTIVPDTPAKRREYEEAVVRTFYLSNADVKEVIDLLRIVVDIRQISAITATNAVSLKDTPERIAAAARLIAAIDKARPEVVIDVELLEVDRTRLREFGLGVASPGSDGINGTADVNRSDLTLQGLRNLTASSVALAGVPGLYYRLLKNDANTRTLANPQLRTSDGIAAQARFGERVPIPVTTFAPIATGGINQQPITSFNYENIGVNIDILPRMHHDDEVSLTLKLVLSSISGVGFGGLPTFGNREISTTIRLKDGETNILAGLIRDEERTTLAGVPGLSDLPLIGHLFASNHKQTQQTDIVLTLTPHIVRVLDLSESDLRPFLMGRDSGSAPTDLPALTPRDQQGDLPMVRDPTNPPPQTPEPPPFPQPLEPSVPGTATPVVPPRK
jgi:general secretion pathway protein D